MRAAFHRPRDRLSRRDGQVRHARWIQRRAVRQVRPRGRRARQAALQVTVHSRAAQRLAPAAQLALRSQLDAATRQLAARSTVRSPRVVHCLLHYCLLHYCLLHYCLLHYCLEHYCSARSRAQRAARTAPVSLAEQQLGWAMHWQQLPLQVRMLCAHQVPSNASPSRPAA
jgi:hypothetical protein